MAIDPRELKPGKCYVTAGEQLRRVIGIRGADVSYEMRTKSMAPGLWGPRRIVSVANFAATVEREVAYDVPAPAAEPLSEPPTPDASISGGPAMAAQEPAADPPPPAPVPARAMVAQARDLLARAVDETDKAEALGLLYAAAGILVRGIERFEQEA